MVFKTDYHLMQVKSIAEWEYQDEVGEKCVRNDAAGFPQALEIMENLEKHKKSSMHGKIMEFEKT